MLQEEDISLKQYILSENFCLKAWYHTEQRQKERVINGQPATDSLQGKINQILILLTSNALVKISIYFD